MAQRRLFSPEIVGSDAFLDMPTSSRELYFQLGMYADDDGFVSPKRIIRMCGASDDDLKVLIAKRFVLQFESGVIVIKHWLIHNSIRKDRYHETKYLEEKKCLIIKENGAYTELATNGLPIGNHPVPEVKLSKVKLSKVNTIPAVADTQSDPPRFSPEGADVIKLFESINSACKNYYNRPPQRQASDDLIRDYGFDRVKAIIEKTLPKTNGREFFPTITTPLQLREKWATLESAVRKYQSEINNKKPKYIS